MDIKFEVRGRPIGKQATHFNRFTGRAYTPSESRYYQEQIALTAQAYMKSNKKEKLLGPIKFTMTIYFLRKKPSPQKHKFFLMHHLNENYPCIKPDTSNVLKPAEDALQGICYDNDMNIVEHHLYKRYNEYEGLEILIEPITE